MLQIRIHGRGGQGAKSTSQLIAETAIKKGKEIQAFPEYGPERSGAPVASFVRIDNKKIRTHEPVLNPDIVIVLDETLIESINVASGLESNGILMINTEKTKEEIQKELLDFDGDIYTISATKIALEQMGQNKPNTAMLGALCRLTNLIDIETLKEVVKEKFEKKIGIENTKSNLKALEIGKKSMI
jgi:2-oxoacid:acceptor oxidoreductase gamma subunit (pyruvate/2-ketoisovalerate family)